MVRLAKSKLEEATADKFTFSEDVMVSGSVSNDVWDQVRFMAYGDEKLIQLKKRQKFPYYELTPQGKEVALRLLKENKECHKSSEADQSCAVHSGNLNAGPVKLLIDYREGGGFNHRYASETERERERPWKVIASLKY